MGTELPTLSLAFIAGLVSFISPCVLPLVPAYVGYMGGRVTSAVARQGGSAAATRSKLETLLHGVFFVLGFTFIFVTVGLLATAFSFLFSLQEILVRLGGIVIILFGLQIMGYLPRMMGWVVTKREAMNRGLGYGIALVVQVLVGLVLIWSLNLPDLGELGAALTGGTLPFGQQPNAVLSQAILPLAGALLYFGWLAWGGAFIRPGDFWANALGRIQGWLYMDTRQQMTARNDRGYLGSAFMGMVFSAGWTPCIGPVYGAILTLAATGQSYATAASLLLAYSLGLGVPFLLTALALGQAQGLLGRLQRHMRIVEVVSGLFLILIGVLVLTGQLQQLSQTFTEGDFGEFSYNLEYCAELFSQHSGFLALLLGLAAAMVVAVMAWRLIARGPQNRLKWLVLPLLLVGLPLITAATFPVGHFNSCMVEGTAFDASTVPGLTVVSDGEGDTGSGEDEPSPQAGLTSEMPNNVEGDTLFADLPSLDSLDGGANGGVMAGLTDLGSISAPEAGSNVPDVGLAAGFRAPDFATTRYSGEAVTLEDYRGQVVVLNFWATWCGPCRAEMPELERAYQAYQDEGLVVLGVNQAESSAAVEAFAATNGLSFPLLLDEDQRINSDYQILGLPTTFIIDANGVIVAQHPGAVTAEQLEGYIAEAFDASAG